LTPPTDRPLLIASGNPNQHREISQALQLPPSQVLTPGDLESTLGTAPDPDETGTTLLENAIIKAREFSLWSGQWALADDTGLFVTALDGDPGVYSARYAGETATFSDNIEKLLTEISARDHASREAYFSCVLALCDGDEVILSVEGRCNGTITESPRGEGGFGYDPVFLPDGETLTFSEMTAEAKNLISHRGLAVRQFSQLFEAALTEGENS
jgi:XTP/dITP diphosphohydrolase